MLKGEVRWFGKRLDTQFTQLKIVPISDLHYGNPLCSLKHFQFTIDFLLKNDDAFTYLNGDLLEAVTLDSKGDIFEQKYTPQKQRDDVIDFVESEWFVEICDCLNINSSEVKRRICGG